MMRIVVGAIILNFIFLSGCVKQSDTPADAFKIVQKAILDEDWEKYWSMLSSDSKKRFDNQVINMQESFGNLADQVKERILKSMDISYDELKLLDGHKFFINFMHDRKADDYSATLFKTCIITKIETKGNRALLYLEDDEGHQEKLPVVQEDGKWKLELSQYYSF